MARREAIWAVPLVIGAVGLTACGSSPSNSSPSSTTAIAPAAALATGSYAPPDAAGTPHYVVKIDSSQGTKFRGGMDFVFQDGRSARAFEFNGVVTGQNATATSSNVASTGSGTPIVSSLPATFQIGIASDTLTFNGCQAYLPQVQSVNACTFTLSR